MASFEEARRSSLPTQIQPGTRGSTSFDSLLLGNAIVILLYHPSLTLRKGNPPRSQGYPYRPESWSSFSSRQHVGTSSEHQDDSESNPSSGQEASPDHSDTDSSSGEATITAGPTSTGNLIGRAVATAANAAWRRHGGADAWFDEREDDVEEFQANGSSGGQSQPQWTAPSSSASLTRTRSNPTGSASQAYQVRESQGWAYSTGTNIRNARNGPLYEHQRKESDNRRWRPTAGAESPRNQHFTTGTPPHPAPLAIAVQYTYPNSANPPASLTPTTSSHIHHPTMDKTPYSVPKAAQSYSRTKQSMTSSSALPIKTNTEQDTRFRTHEATVSRTASLPKLTRLHGFSPITPLRALKDDPSEHPHVHPQGSHALANEADDSSDPEGIYMDVSHSRRKRSLRRRKAASDGSRTPVSPAIPLRGSVSPALSSVSFSLNASPVSNVLGHNTYKKNTVPGDYQHNYAARMELKKRRGSQQNSYQAPQALHSAYAYHIPPRLAHQPRSNFSVASTSGGSAGVSSGYTASADSGDTRSDLDSPGALGLSLGEASDSTSRHRMHSRSAQDSVHLRSMGDTAHWDSTVCRRMSD